MVSLGRILARFRSRGEGLHRRGNHIERERFVKRVRERLMRKKERERGITCGSIMEGRALRDRERKKDRAEKDPSLISNLGPHQLWDGP